MIERASASLPETIFTILSMVWVLSPGFMRSGEYPVLKSVPCTSPDIFSNTGMQTSSVTPGYTVLSYTTIDPRERFHPTVFVAEITQPRSGLFEEVTGVGTLTMMKLHRLMVVGSSVKD